MRGVAKSDLELLKEQMRELKRENAALREHHQQDEALIVQRTDEIRHLETENAALRADKERLDWLQNSPYWPHPPLGEDIRATIDAARKEHP